MRWLDYLVNRMVREVRFNIEVIALPCREASALLNTVNS